MKRNWLRVLQLVLLGPLLMSAGGSAAQVLPQPFAAEVRRVLDGDTFSARTDGQTFVVRLARIDAPEGDQPYGRNARRALEDLVKKRKVQIEPMGVDQEGRIVGKVSFYGTDDLSAVLVEQGFAWVAPPYREDPDLLGLEQEARKRHRGLWADTQGPVPPWEWQL